MGSRRSALRFWRSRDLRALGFQRMGFRLFRDVGLKHGGFTYLVFRV